jgi:hypothetical protein
MLTDFIIVLAWPEGYVKAANAWYDKIFSFKGKYRVGHSALILIDSKSLSAKYFDFGRYHTPDGYGRVRDEETDHEFALPKVEIANNQIKNIKEILFFVSKIKSTHAEGKLYASVISNVDYKSSYLTAKRIQKKEALIYGPFVINGTNCSRFVSKVIRSSKLPIIKRLRFRFPFCISPSPARNVSIGNNNYFIVDNSVIKEVKKTKVNAYFSSIESWKV